MMESITAAGALSIKLQFNNARMNYMYVVGDLCDAMNEEGSKHSTALNDEMHDKMLIMAAAARAERCHSYGPILIANLLSKGWRGQETRTVYRLWGDTYGDFYLWDGGECRQYTRGPISEVDEDVFESWYNILIAAMVYIRAKNDYDKIKQKAIKFNDEMYEIAARDEDALASLRHKNNRHDNIEKKRLQMNIDWYLSRIVEIPD